MPLDAAERISTAPSNDDLERAIQRAAKALERQQQPDGHFVFELEADATIPSEYILLKHFLAESVPEVEQKIAVYLRRIQGPDGGWPLLHGGSANVSSSVKAYFALKLCGDEPDAPHMKRARERILALGGVAKTNVFTRTSLALFGVVPWRAVPVMPVEIMLLPRWFPFQLYKMSYWARCTLVPMMVLAAYKPVARNPLGIGIPELFVKPAEQVRYWPGSLDAKQPWKAMFGAIDAVLRRTERFFIKRVRAEAIRQAIAYVRERLNGDDGLGAIYPAMANTIMMFDMLGVPADDPEVLLARQAVEKLLVVKDDEAYCQPCMSPVWDTALTAHTLMEIDGAGSKRADRAMAWLKPRQVLDVKGDWAVQRPDLRPGGWAFQYENPHYPDLDDTAVVVMAMHRADQQTGQKRYAEAVARGIEWVVGLQSADGGWGAFDANNNKDYLNAIPFADHGALLDPPTADVTARCVSMLGQFGKGPDTSAALQRGLQFLRRTQEKDGSWYGRWGLNYIYGTWSVLCALNAAGLSERDPALRRAATWLLTIQNRDGGWGEDDRSYDRDYAAYRPAPSTASQTAWALLGLMAAGKADHPAVKRGIAYLTLMQGDDGFWPEEGFTATGFPRVFYLRYHGYPKFFPLWAMARFRNLQASNTKTVFVGM